MMTPPTRNIFIELELSLDPPITEVGAMKEYLEKTFIPFWNSRCNSHGDTFKTFIANAKKHINGGLPDLQRQAREAYTLKYEELTRRARKIIDIGVTERNVKNLVKDFENFFQEDTIKKLVPVESPSSKQSDDEFIVPVCPDKLKCKTEGDKPVSHTEMCKISRDVRVVTDGRHDSLYDLVDANDEEKLEKIHEKITVIREKMKSISQSGPDGYKYDALNRLDRQFGSMFKTDAAKTKYDVAIKRFRFDEWADANLKIYVDGWIPKKKTDWNQYHELINEVVKALGYTQEEAAWLVYEYFCLPEGKKCPLPEKPKPIKGGIWGEQYEKLRTHLVYLFEESIKYHNSTPRIKSKLQSVIDKQFKERIDPNDVPSTVKKIINEELREFWDSCKYDGIATIPLFKPAMLANFLACYPKLRDSLQYFVP